MEQEKKYNSSTAWLYRGLGPLPHVHSGAQGPLPCVHSGAQGMLYQLHVGPHTTSHVPLTS